MFLELKIAVGHIKTSCRPEVKYSTDIVTCSASFSDQHLTFPFVSSHSHLILSPTHPAALRLPPPSCCPIKTGMMSFSLQLRMGRKPRPKVHSSSSILCMSVPCQSVCLSVCLIGAHPAILTPLRLPQASVSGGRKEGRKALRSHRREGLEKGREEV